ncbi:hypothetical protein D9M71_378400 [compost metagenome]
MAEQQVAGLHTAVFRKHRGEAAVERARIARRQQRKIEIADALAGRRGGSSFGVAGGCRRSPGAVGGLARGALLRAVLQVGQYPGLHQPLVELVVEGAELAHHLLVEQHVEHGLDAQRERAFRQGFAEGAGDRLGAEGVVVLAELAAVVEQGQALFEGEQRLHALRLDLVDHVGDQQGFLVLVRLHQRQLVDVQFIELVAGGKPALEEVHQPLGDALVIGALQGGPLAADLAHAVEEQRLDLVVLGLLGALEERVVDLGEDFAQQLGQAVHRQLPAVLHELAEARLYAATGDGRWRWRVLVTHWRSCP